MVASTFINLGAIYIFEIKDFGPPLKISRLLIRANFKFYLPDKLLSLLAKLIHTPLLTPHTHTLGGDGDSLWLHGRSKEGVLC